MSKYKVTVKVEQTYEIHADSALIAVRRARQMAIMAHPKGKLVAVRADRETSDKST